jgi:hypothetical protein
LVLERTLQGKAKNHFVDKSSTNGRIKKLKKKRSGVGYGNSG